MFRNLLTNENYAEDSVKVLNILKSLHTNLEESKKNNLKYKEKLCNLVQTESLSISNHISKAQYNQQYQEIQKDFLDKKHSLEIVYKSELEQVENELKLIQINFQQTENDLKNQYNDLQIISDAEISESKSNKDKELLTLNKQFQYDNQTEEVLRNELRNIRQQSSEYKEFMQQKISKLELQLEKKITNEKQDISSSNEISRQIPDTTTSDNDNENILEKGQPIILIEDPKIISKRSTIPTFRGKYRKRSHNNLNIFNESSNNSENKGIQVIPKQQDEPPTSSCTNNNNQIIKEKKIRKLFDPTDTSYMNK